MRRFAVAAFVLLTSLAAVAAPVPLINSATVDYNTNQITINGQNFSAGIAPTVLFNGVSLAPLVSFTNLKIVANHLGDIKVREPRQHLIRWRDLYKWPLRDRSGLEKKKPTFFDKTRISNVAIRLSPHSQGKAALAEGKSPPLVALGSLRRNVLGGPKLKARRLFRLFPGNGARCPPPQLLGFALLRKLAGRKWRKAKKTA